MKNKIKNLRNEYEYDCYLNSSLENRRINPTRLGFVSFIIKDSIHFIIMMIVWNICKRRGHQYENTGGHANGDTGSDEFTCSRCGHSINHVYY